MDELARVHSTGGDADPFEITTIIDQSIVNGLGGNCALSELDRSREEKPKTFPLPAFENRFKHCKSMACYKSIASFETVY